MQSQSRKRALAKNILRTTSEYLRRAGKNLLNFQQLPPKAKTFSFFKLSYFFGKRKYLRQNLKKLKKEQRSLSRKFQKGKEQSNNYRKQRLKVAKIHEKISNQRKDYLHKLTTYLASTYETVCIEDLAVKNMVKNHNLALSINDCGWAMFRQMLEYKVKDLRVIGRFSPSSKMCSCGVINNDLKLSDRHWACGSCNTTHDRDVLAANNIKKFGLRASTLNVKTDR